MKPTTPCPTCGHLNESKRASCSMCECALIGKVGRPSSQVKSTTQCPCGQIDCSDHIGYPCGTVNSARNLVCNNCRHLINKQRVLRGRPVERREICQNCLYPNI